MYRQVTIFSISYLFSALHVTTALAGGTSSGGGGAYVCRDRNGQMSSAKLVDLWESENSPFEWGNGTQVLKVDYDNATPEQQQVDNALTKLDSFDTTLGSTVRLLVDEIRKNVRPLPSGVALTVPNDLQTDYFPVGCPPEGMLRYNGVTSALEMRTDIFEKLETKTDTAAAYLHEAIYKAFRDGFDRAHDSTLARRLVACLFSKNCMVPSNFALPTKIIAAYSCSSGANLSETRKSNVNALLYLTDEQPASRSWRVVITKIGTIGFASGAYLDFSVDRLGTCATADGRSTDENTHHVPTGWLERFGYHPFAAEMLVTYLGTGCPVTTQIELSNLTANLLLPKPLTAEFANGKALLDCKKL
jgi:hypothetical protein